VSLIKIFRFILYINLKHFLNHKFILNFNCYVRAKLFFNVQIFYSSLKLKNPFRIYPKRKNYCSNAGFHSISMSRESRKINKIFYRLWSAFMWLIHVRLFFRKNILNCDYHQNVIWMQMCELQTLRFVDFVNDTKNPRSEAHVHHGD
jgi:hypothetical protein